MAAYEDKLNGVAKEGKNSIAALDILQPRFANMDLDWLVHLHKYGWAVVTIPDWTIEFTDMFLYWFETCSVNFNKADHTTWKSANMPIMFHGILKHYFGHTELQWRIRELCAPIFARIWECQPEDLLSSYDGDCF